MAIGTNFASSSGVNFANSTSVNWRLISKIHAADSLLCAGDEDSNATDQIPWSSFISSKSVKFSNSTSVNWFSNSGKRTWESILVELAESSKIFVKTSSTVELSHSQALIESLYDISKSDTLRLSLLNIKNLYPKVSDLIKVKINDVKKSLGILFTDQDSIAFYIASEVMVILIATTETYSVRLIESSKIIQNSSDDLLFDKTASAIISPISSDSLGMLFPSEDSTQAEADEVVSLDDLLFDFVEYSYIAKYFPPTNYLQESLLGLVSESDRFLVIGKVVLPGGKVQLKLVKL